MTPVTDPRRRGHAFRDAPLVLALLVASAGLLAPMARAETQLFPRISVFTPPGWDAAIVARSIPGATAGGPLATDGTLDPAQPVWLDWAVTANAAIGGYWRDQLLLDGEPIQSLPRWHGSFTPKQWYALDAGPVYVPGGRHTLSAIADAGNVLEDPDDRHDNRADRQLIWAPQPLPAAGTWGSLVPPPAPFVAQGLPANNHAFSVPAPVEPWVVALRPLVDLDLVLFDDYTSSTQGLTHELGRSSRTADSLDLLVTVPDGVTPALFPAVERKPVPGEGGGYLLHVAGLEGRHDPDGEAFWGAESLAAYQFANLYSVQLEAGRTYPISLWRRVGSQPIHFAVLAVAPGAAGSLAEALVRSQPVPWQDYEVASFSPATSGTYLIIAYRDDHETDPERYQLAIGSQAVGVVAGPAGGTWLEALPNPSSAPPSLRFTLSEAAHARLEVLDVQGRHVRTVLDGEQPAGTHAAVWDLRDDEGAAVAPGLYWARLEVAGRERRVRLAVVR